MLGGRSRAVFFLVLGLLLLGDQANAEQDEGKIHTLTLNLIWDNGLIGERENTGETKMDMGELFFTLWLYWFFLPLKVTMKCLKRWKWRWVSCFLLHEYYFIEGLLSLLSIQAQICPPVLRQTRPILGIPWTTLKMEKDILKSVQILSIARSGDESLWWFQNIYFRWCVKKMQDASGSTGRTPLAPCQGSRSPSAGWKQAKGMPRKFQAWSRAPSIVSHREAALRGGKCILGTSWTDWERECSLGMAKAWTDGLDGRTILGARKQKRIVRYVVDSRTYITNLYDSDL